MIKRDSSTTVGMTNITIYNINSLFREMTIFYHNIMLNQNESLAEKFIRRGFWLYLFSFLVGPLGYAVKIILSHDLSVEEIGLFYGVMSLIMLLAVYHDLGLTESLNFFLPKCIVQKDWTRFKSLVVYSLVAQFVTSIII